VRRTTLQTPRPVKKEGRRCSRHWSKDSPAAHGKDHCEAGCSPAAHGCPQWSRYPPAAHEEPHARASCEAPQPIGRTQLEQFMRKGPHAGAGAECEESFP